MNLVQRIKQQYPEQHIESLNPDMCPCLTMNRIDLPHLLWAMEQFDRGEPVGVIRVDAQIRQDAVLALNRMLAIR